MSSVSDKARWRSRRDHLSGVLPFEHQTEALTWYIAYGSNMNRGIFESRRGMRPIQARPAWLENYYLRFNLAIGPGERGVANLESLADART